MRLETFSREEVTAAVEAAIKKAVEETLAAGVPIFYYDWDLGIDIMMLPDGRKFEIRYIPGVPGDRNHEIIREIKAAALLTPVLTVLAGPNGSGKSSITSSLEFEGRENLLDPDAIARRINPADPYRAAVAAGREVITRTRQYLTRARASA
jgi:hypothetical protein